MTPGNCLDTFNYFAIYNDNINDYIGSKEPNYFMGPFYDIDTVNKADKKNTNNQAGEDYSDPTDQCFFLHADMLHASPACIGIAHDPEVETVYGVVYWAFDTTGDNSGYDGGQLVKFAFFAAPWTRIDGSQYCLGALLSRGQTIPRGRWEEVAACWSSCGHGCPPHKTHYVHCKPR